MKNHKAAGEDNIAAELVKATSDESLVTWLKLYNCVRNTERIPSDWRNGTIVKIPKKGDLSDCNNWRGMTLLSVPEKILCSILLNRIRLAVDHVLREEQAGFRPGKSCIDQIFALRNILEQSNEWQSPLIINFIDFQKAFDSVDHKALWRIMELYGIPVKIIDLIKNLYENSTCTALVNGKRTDPFPVNTGVRQGCILSPILFCIAIDFVMRTTNETKTGIKWAGDNCLGDLDYADDIWSINSSVAEKQEKATAVSKQACKLVLIINKNKTEVMRNLTDRTPITLDGTILKEAEKFTYLESTVAMNGECLIDIRCRLGKAASEMTKLGTIWKNKSISQKTKLKLYRSNILSVLLYGAECWGLTAGIEKKLASFHQKCLRRILNIRWNSYISNEVVLERADDEDLRKTIRRRR